MDKQIKIEIEELMEELFADDYKRGEDWNGYEVYEPLYKKPIFLGPPLVVFVKNNDVRMSTPEESFAYLKFIQGDEEFED